MPSNQDKKRLADLELYNQPIYEQSDDALRSFVAKEGARLKCDREVEAMLSAGRLIDDGQHIKASDPEDLDALIIAEIVRLTFVKPTMIYADDLLTGDDL